MNDIFGSQPESACSSSLLDVEQDLRGGHLCRDKFKVCSWIKASIKWDRDISAAGGGGNSPDHNSISV